MQREKNSLKKSLDKAPEEEGRLQGTLADYRQVLQHRQKQTSEAESCLQQMKKASLIESQDVQASLCFDDNFL